MLNFDPSKLAEVPAPVAKFSVSTGGGYDATIAKGRRKPPIARSRSEDAELNNSERGILTTTTRDLRRNFVAAAWAIRKHLDYVSTFSFQSRCSHNRLLLSRYSLEVLQALDAQMEAIVRKRSRAANFDASGRFSLQRMIRLAEALRTVDGDVLFLKRRDKKVQLVEGDRIRNPFGTSGGSTGLAPEDLQNIVNGVLIDPTNAGGGSAVGYCVHKRDRTGNTMTFDRLVPAKFARLHFYGDRYDQVRGISPLAAAVNQFRDLYESFELALAKEKVAQLFAMIVTRKNAEKIGIDDDDDDDESSAQCAERKGYPVEFGKGPIFLDMDPEDDAKFLGSQNPSGESQAFWQFVLMLALKALDIPFSFFDESHTNYSGLRVAWLMYDQSAATKREDNRELLDDWTAWQMILAVLDDELVLPRGLNVADLAWTWVSKGVPWVDQLKEVTGNIAAIAAGLADPQTVLQGQGIDPFSVIDGRAEYEAYAKSKNVALSFIPPVLPPSAFEDDAAGGNSGKPEKKK